MYDETFFGMFTTRSCKNAPNSFYRSVHLLARHNLRTGQWISWNVVLGDYIQICEHIQILVKVRHR